MADNFDEYGQPIGPVVPGWAPRPLPARVTLQGEYCRLEPLSAAAHGPALHQAFAADGRVFTYMTYGPFSSERDYLSYAQELEDSNTDVSYAVIGGNEQPVGLVSLIGVRAKHGSIEIGNVRFSPLMQRTRMGTESLYLLMRYVFEALLYRRCEWRADSHNAKSRRAAARLGFRYEGILRQLLVYKGRSLDMACFSVLDSEWPRNKAALRAWLAAENFDAEGLQKRTLESCRNEQ